MMNPIVLGGIFAAVGVVLYVIAGIANDDPNWSLLGSLRMGLLLGAVAAGVAWVMEGSEDAKAAAALSTVASVVSSTASEVVTGTGTGTGTGATYFTGEPNF